MLELEEIRLTIDEREAIRLAHLDGMSHEEAGQMMGVSRATFGRIIEQARKVVADALINGKAINVEGGNYEISCTDRLFVCEKCEYEWHEDFGTGPPRACPSCRHTGIHRVSSK
jgi:predicted DNA-binding protein (UPF0251 family)